MHLQTEETSPPARNTVFVEVDTLAEIDRVDFQRLIPGWEEADLSWLDDRLILCLYGRKWYPGEAPTHWSGAEKEADPYAETIVLLYDIRAGKFVPFANGSDALPRRIESISGWGNCFYVVDKDLLGQGPEVNTIWFKVTEE
jgi:hypothetical protein